MPGAQCTRSLVCESGGWNAHEYSQRVHRKTPGIPTQWFTAYTVLSPVTGFLATVIPEKVLLKNLTPASGCQDHTVLPSASAPFVKSASASTASQPAFVTIAKRPSHRAGRREFYTDLGFLKIRIFLQRGLDRKSRRRLICLVRADGDCRDAPDVRFSAQQRRPLGLNANVCPRCPLPAERSGHATGHLTRPADWLCSRSMRAFHDAAERYRCWLSARGALVLCVPHPRLSSHMRRCRNNASS